MKRLFLLTCVFVGIVGCGSDPPPSPAGPVATATAPTAATATADDAPQAAFDRPAAAKALAAVDTSACFDKPPLEDAPLHVTMTLMPEGKVTDASADAPYYGTPAGECAAKAFLGTRVAAWVGPPIRMGHTVPHAHASGEGATAPFDASQARAAIAASDLTECVQMPGAGIDKTRASVLVAPTGDVKSVALDGAIQGTPRGACIERVLKGLMFKPYTGEQAPAVHVDIDVRTPPPAPAKTP